MVDGQVHWFGVAGLANGLAVMRDEESLSLWDHITGECFAGPLEARRLEFWHAGLTNVAAELANHPDTILLRSGYRSLKSALMGRVIRNRTSISNKGTLLAPQFRLTMSQAIDRRLPEGELGLGLMDDLNQGRFYPVAFIPKGGSVEDEWLGRPLRIERNGLDGVPLATWTDTGEIPMQLLARWYGFSFTYPGCEIYAAAAVT